jgi:propanol-preferring alcohol dehydrogenase
MLAVRLAAPRGPLSLEEVPLPEPRGGEVRVRVAGCGVCRTDLHILRGEQTRVRFPLTLGHEVAGWVDAYGPDLADAPPLPIGGPVVVFGGWGCGECDECRAGEEQRCADGSSPGFQRDGGYAEALLVPSARHLVPLRNLDPVRAAPLADAGVTPYRAVRRAEPWLRPAARVLLIGCGALGQFALQYLRRHEGLAVAVRDTDPAKLALARSLGAISGDGAGGFDVVFDLVGTDATLRDAAVAVRPGGLVMLVGEGGGELPVSFESPAVEASVTTAAWGSLDDLRDVVALTEAGEVAWEVETMPLRDAPLALERLERGEVRGRIVLVP